ncbi:MAG: hypothetical protein ACTSYA_11690, partial [Candidatus Kariarchaeaceae archaeon]
HYHINFLLDLPDCPDFDNNSFRGSCCTYTLLESLDQVDYLIAIILHDLFTSLNLDKDLPFIHIENFLHEFYYEGQVEHFLKDFYDYYI